MAKYLLLLNGTMWLVVITFLTIVVYLGYGFYRVMDVITQFVGEHAEDFE